MSKQKPRTPYEEACRNLDRIIAELNDQLNGWTPKEERK